MLISWLRISASVLILLGLMATKDSTLAMEWTEEEKTTRSSSIGYGPNIASLSFTETQENDEDKKSTAVSPGQIVPSELLVHTFSFLNYLDKVNAAKVCKLWYSLIDPTSHIFSMSFLKSCQEQREFDQALLFLKSFHSKNSRIWDNYAFNVGYDLKYSLNSPTLIDPTSIKNFIEAFSTFFPQEKKAKNIFNLSLGRYPQYLNVLCFLNLPVDSFSFGRGVSFLDFSFSDDSDAWKIFADYLHELWCDYDQEGSLISTKKDKISTDAVNQFVQIFIQKFPEAQEHPSIVSLSHASSFDSEGHEEP